MVFLLSGNPSSKDAQESAVSKGSPLDLVDTTREGLLDPNLTVRIASRSFDDTFTVTPKDTPRDQEGLQ